MLMQKKARLEVGLRAFWVAHRARLHRRATCRRRSDLDGKRQGVDMTTPQLPAPWGLRQVVPVLNTHRVQLTDTGVAPAFSQTLHAVPLGASEFTAALRDYPIVFVRRQPRTFEPMAILGIQEGQNLFVMPDGRWDRRTYIPAYVRRYPFCIVSPQGEGGASRRVICVDPRAVVETGDPLFDPSGAPLPHWTAFERVLNDYENELRRAHDLGATLDRLGVLAPFSLRADLSIGVTLSLNDLYRVDRDKLAALDVQALRDLIAKGQMESVYAHMLSQDNFLRLISRRGTFATRAAA
jgi:hypothetical protein